MRRDSLMMSFSALVLGLIGFSAVHAESIASAETAVHASCTNCHARGKALKAATIDELCFSCHPGNAKDHVLGVVSVTPVSSLPLDKGGKVTCFTCHEPHGKGSTDKLLRLEKGQLCISCHQPK